MPELQPGTIDFIRKKSTEIGSGTIERELTYVPLGDAIQDIRSLGAVGFTDVELNSIFATFPDIITAAIGESLSGQGDDTASYIEKMTRVLAKVETRRLYDKLQLTEKTLSSESISNHIKGDGSIDPNKSIETTLYEVVGKLASERFSSGSTKDTIENGNRHINGMAAIEAFALPELTAICSINEDTRQLAPLLDDKVDNEVRSKAGILFVDDLIRSEQLQRKLSALYQLATTNEAQRQDIRETLETDYPEIARSMPSDKDLRQNQVIENKFLQRSRLILPRQKSQGLYKLQDLFNPSKSKPDIVAQSRISRKAQK